MLKYQNVIDARGTTEEDKIPGHNELFFREKVFLTIVFLAVSMVALSVCSVASAEVKIKQTTETIDVAADAYSVKIDLTRGVWDAWWGDGAPLISNAFAVWQLDSGGDKKSIVSTGNRNCKSDINNFFDRIGEGREAVISFEDSDLEMRFELKFRFYHDKPFFVILQSVENKSGAPVRISDSAPLQAESKHDGGFFPGPSPADVWILENGYKFMFDFFVRVVRGDELMNSNWNAAFFDRTTHRTSLIGFITADKGMVSVRSYFDKESSTSMGTWNGVSQIKTDASYDPSISIAPGESFESERLFVGVSTEPQPHPTLERFADAVAEQYEIKNWDAPIPTGWNSWATIYHHGINEENILENARWAAANMLPFGMTTFQIDDGWQIVNGDWEPNEKFPHGMKWMAGQIAALGFTPGLWIEPFCVSSDSAIAHEHPDWIVRKNPMAETLMPKDWLILDLTHPEVKIWLGDLFRKIGRDWGFKTIKIDFIYYALLGKNYYNPDISAVQAYREGIQIIREALPDDAFLLAVGVPVANGAGLVNGMRLGLDITPNWQDDEGYAAQGIKPMVRNLARRYYLNHRVWINHPDMFYLGSPEETERWGSRLTLDEARCYATLASLVGGITKIGDSFIGLDEAQTDLLRRLLPVYPDSARPLDLFERLYPEKWHLPIRKQELQYDVVALFNWGRNRRWGVLEEETEKPMEVRFAELGLSSTRKYLVTEFWSGKYMGVFTESFTDTLPPRSVRVYSIHEVGNSPQFIGTNRHITQGATDIESVKWDALSGKLSGTQKVDPGFDYKIMIFVPENFTLLRADIGGEQTEVKTEGSISVLHFNFPDSGIRTWNLYFEEK
jgi:hypothetical protein